MFALQPLPHQESVLKATVAPTAHYSCSQSLCVPFSASGGLFFLSVTIMGCGSHLLRCGGRGGYRECILIVDIKPALKIMLKQCLYSILSPTPQKQCKLLLIGFSSSCTQILMKICLIPCLRSRGLIGNKWKSQGLKPSRSTQDSLCLKVILTGEIEIIWGAALNGQYP